MLIVGVSHLRKVSTTTYHSGQLLIPDSDLTPDYHFLNLWILVYEKPLSSFSGILSCLFPMKSFFVAYKLGSSPLSSFLFDIPLFPVPEPPV